MILKNPIGWCDATTNAVTGCEKVSPGCKNCYAEICPPARILRAQGIETWGPKGTRHPVNFEDVFSRLNKLCICPTCSTTGPFILNRQRCECTEYGPPMRRIRLFADSNSDWLDEKWPIDIFARFINTIRLAPNINVLLLTKRIENWKSRMQSLFEWIPSSLDYRTALDLRESGFVESWLAGFAPPNVWLGVSVEDQKRADERIDTLLTTPAAVRFLSCEPLLEEVQLPYQEQMINNGKRWMTTGINRANIDWVIVGGESGKNRKDVPVEAIQGIALQCVKANVPVYVKQDSHRLPGQQGRIINEFWRLKQTPTGGIVRTGTKAKQ